MWGATNRDPNAMLTVMFQSTHPCGVRPAEYVKSATRSAVSIHAPVWGATSQTVVNFSLLFGFNPRTRVGCDTENDKLTLVVIRVSIHAPVWGATIIFVTFNGC